MSRKTRYYLVVSGFALLVMILLIPGRLDLLHLGTTTSSNLMPNGNSASENSSGKVSQLNGRSSKNDTTNYLCPIFNMDLAGSPLTKYWWCRF